MAQSGETQQYAGAAAASLAAAGLEPYVSTQESMSQSQSHGSLGSSTLSDLGMGSPGASLKRRKSELDSAIERGDWLAVGDAAAMLNDNSTTGTLSTHDDVRGKSVTSTLGSSTIGTPRSKEEREDQLDEMIAAGNWDGIVAAAADYHSMDSEADSSISATISEEGSSSKNSLLSETRPDTTTTTTQPKAEVVSTSEEIEALAQADMWQTIANQSRKESSDVTQGASDAADWAISRSLSLMKRSGESGPSGPLMPPDLDKEEESV